VQICLVSALASITVSMFIVPLEGFGTAGIIAGVICLIAVFVKP